MQPASTGQAGDPTDRGAATQGETQGAGSAASPRICAVIIGGISVLFWVAFIETVATIF